MPKSVTDLCHIVMRKCQMHCTIVYFPRVISCHVHIFIKRIKVASINNFNVKLLSSHIMLIFPLKTQYVWHQGFRLTGAQWPLNFRLGPLVLRENACGLYAYDIYYILHVTFPRETRLYWLKCFIKKNLWIIYKYVVCYLPYLFLLFFFSINWISRVYNM